MNRCGQYFSQSSPGNRPPFNRQGFALVATISVMVLLVMIALAILSLSVIEIRSSRAEDAQHEARANARVALMLALGELQKHAGADRRVTAGASILEDPEGNSKLANRHWTGVWRTDGLKSDPLSGSTPLIHRKSASSGQDAGSLLDRRGAEGSYNAADEVLTWLVSASQNVSKDPTQSLGGSDVVTLVGSHSVDQASEEVTVGKVNLDAGGVSRGGLAWWVGDEGVKARVDLSPVLEEPAVAWNLPPQFGVSAIEGYSSYQTADDSDYQKTISHSSSGIEGGLGIDQLDRRKHFHDLTYFSEGVISDSLRGGLRRDLTFFLNEGSAPKLGSRSGLESADPILGGIKLKDVSARFGLLQKWNEIGVSQGASARGVDVVAPKNQANGTGWGWDSNYTQYEYASGIDLSSQDTPPIHPVMVDASISYGISLWKLGGSVNGVGRYRVNIHYYPRVVLWNPYNVTLKPEKYAVQINMPHQFDVRLIVPGSQPQVLRYFEPFHQQYIGENLPHRPHFSIPVTSFEPGEALLFTADAGGANFGNKFWGYPNTATARSLNTFQLSCKKTAPFNDNFYVRTQRIIEIPDSSVQNAAYQVYAVPDGIWKLYWYKLYLNQGGGDDVSSIKNNPSGFPPLQFICQTESGAAGSSGPWYNSIPPSASAPLRRFDQSPVQAYYRFKWGHRMQWLTDTVENQSIKQGNYNTPYLGYNTIANHNMRAGWHVRSPVEVAFRASQSTARYTHGISIDDPYGWSWDDASLYPVSATSGNRVSPFGRPGEFGALTYPMLDIPGERSPLISLAALQHAPISQFPWHPTYAIGNGYADPRVGRNHTGNFFGYRDWHNIGVQGQAREWSRIRQAHVNSDLNNANFLYDLSYEANYSLWDRYFLSTVPRSGYILGEPLANHRLIISNDVSIATGSAIKDFHRAAQHLIVKGAFNINSTSIDAWAALFSSMRANPEMKIDVEGNGSITANDVYARLLTPYKAKYDGESAQDQSMWNGYRQLTDEQIRELAEEMVKEVKQRGPFISLADFINRRLVEPPKTSGSETEFTKTGLKGALQAAIDRTTINAKHHSQYKIDKTEYEMGGSPQQVKYGASYPELSFPVKNGNQGFGPKPDHNHWVDTKLVGAPSYLTQADMLQKLGPVLSARSDTFVIRAYGESTEPGGKVRARAWCEAVVQRTAKPFSPDSTGIDPEADLDANPTAAFGRTFKIITFRWLSTDEI